MDGKNLTLLVALDISAAFDALEHDILLRRLERTFGISDLALTWIKSYSSERTQFVKINDGCSEKLPCKYGVPQGSILGPILFTKDALTDYLAHKLLQHAHQTSQKYVVAWRAEAAASHCAVDFLSSTQEEADTKIILHAVNAKERGATRLDIFAQDTDVVVLAVRRYPELPRESFFVPSIQNKISIRRIFMSLGALKSSALPAFHALSGCDTTGSLVGKGKLSYWKVFNASNEKNASNTCFSRNL